MHRLPRSSALTFRHAFITKGYIVAILLCLALTSCQLPSPWPAETTPHSSAGLPSPRSSECLGELARSNPGTPPSDPGAPIGEPLSPEQLSDYLRIMGIDSFCIPPSLGQPTLNIDWNDLTDPPIAIGRMVSIGFDGLDAGAYGWGKGFILYSTYNFAVGSEYEVFATVDDLRSTRDHSMPRMIALDGVDGFLRYTPGIAMGTQPVYLTYVFPFDSFYIAAVLSLGSYDPSLVSDIVSQMEAGQHPDLANPDVAPFKELVSSIRFQ